MKVIGQIGDEYLIQATDNEIKEILGSVTGKRPDKIQTGDKIPAIDYAATITKIKTLKDDAYFKNLISYGETFNKTLKTLIEKVEQTNNINI